MQIEGTPCSLKPALRAGDNGAEFEGRMNVGKENFLVLEIIERFQVPAGRHALEEFRRRFV